MSAAEFMGWAGLIAVVLCVVGGALMRRIEK
jgi:hypothetical protein